MKLPRLRQHLIKLQCDITIIATDWFLCLFATVLPSEVSPESAHRVACLLLLSLSCYQDAAALCNEQSTDMISTCAVCNAAVGCPASRRP